MTAKTPLPLDVTKLLAILQPNGVLSNYLKGFESREQQQKMLCDIVESYNLDQIALIEAGTGTGKSIAYLLPAIFWAYKKKERTVISTNTINLQEQLIEKDIPLLLKALDIDIKAVLVKGMSNYLCLRKLQEAKEEILFYPENEVTELNRIEAWKETTKKGSKSELPFLPSATTWERVCAESDTCNRTQCPYYDACYFFKARKRSSEAQLLVANHHLLFADLAMRSETNDYESDALLPKYTKIVLDEAHNVEDIATEYFANKFSKAGVMRILARLSSEKNNKAFGKLPLLKQKLSEFYNKKGNRPSGDAASVIQRLNVAIPGERRDFFKLVIDTFQIIEEVIAQLLNPEERQGVGEPLPETKLRLRERHREHPLWKQDLIPRVQELIETSKRFLISLRSLETDIANLRDDKVNELTSGIRFEITALTNRLEETFSVLNNFIFVKDSIENVRWIEIQRWKTMNNVTLVEAKLDISDVLAKSLFNKFPSTVLCSATLTTDQKFDFIRSRLGLVQEKLGAKKVTERSYDSPFDYRIQALLGVPTDIPAPDHPQFLQAACEKIWETIQASRGNAFVLFTSYSMLMNCYQQLVTKLQNNRYHVLKQGDDNRQALLNRFKENEYSVLFGTDSFWEGVDVAGDALRCVIIVKLPFQVPSEPLFQARSESITAKGGSAFMEYAVPNAIVKFKQGFGRLIRNKNDRGCIVCLDNRLVTKQYGRLFLNSLPPCQKIFDLSAGLKEKMSDFYRKTYYLVKK